MTDWSPTDSLNALDIAVIAMAGRFPGAPDVERFWANLRDGVESIRFYSEEELIALGADPAVVRAPSYVKAAALLPDVDLFDAGFFGFSPREAEILDPQQRLFLECAWEALERAGYDSERYAGLIGVYAGSGTNEYLLFHLLRGLTDLHSVLQLTIGNEKDFLATRVSYELDLKGPSINVQTGCSSSLVAVHLACQALLAYQCDMALAGGVSLQLPEIPGYPYTPGGVLSPDGHCRAFSGSAQGAVAGSGLGIAVLKRLADALADGDTIHAVIKGSALNNDGAAKIGYTAPSIEGQARVIDMAQAAAAVDPRSITYVEAHGSGTPLGDPIEVTALTRAFRAGTEERGFCALGSVKTNIGHVDTAAGMAGLIKTVLALEHRQIPPSLHFDRPNPQIDFADSPFYVNGRLADWPAGETPRRAGVSSFGIGGTNAHVILEEAPPAVPPSSPPRPWDVLVLSARSAEALERATDDLASHLEAHPGENLSDVAWTLQAGRRRFLHRRALVCAGGETTDAAKALRERDPRRLLDAEEEAGDRSVAFLFPGLGDHYPRMAAGLYQDEPVFRREIDHAAEILRPLLGLDLRAVLFPAADAPVKGGRSGPDLRAMLGQKDPLAGSPLARTSLAQPAVFAVEVALARLWMSRGVRPSAMLGYSLGEYAAACVAGVFSFADGLRVVAERARLIEGLPAGAMLAVPLPEEQAAAGLSGRLSIAAVNGPAMSVVAGPPEEVEALARELGGRGVVSRALPTTHAFHSWMMEPIAGAVAELLGSVRLAAPSIPYVSDVTGTWITASEATDPAYWVAHLLQPVRFGKGIEELGRDASRALLEVGPGQSLGSLALQLLPGGERVVASSLRNAWVRQADGAFLLAALAKLWLAGCRIDWAGLHAGESRRRVPLPTYPFERKRYWITAPAGARPFGVLSAPAPDHEPALVASSSSAPRHGRPSLRNAFVPPGTELERAVAALWERLLGIEGIGLHDNFFELGGHSLLGTQLVNMAREVLGADVPLNALFETPTVAGMTTAVAAERAAAGGGAGQAPPLVPVPRDGKTELPLSFSQSRMWFLHQLDPVSPVYNIPFAVRLTGDLDPAALLAAVRAVVARHEALRTRFPAVAGTAAQAIAPADEAARGFAVPLIDLGSLPEALRASELAQLSSLNARLPFDLTAGPLLRVTLVRLSGGPHPRPLSHLPPTPPPGEGGTLAAGQPGSERHPEGEGRAGRIWAEERSALSDPSARPSRQDDSSVAFLPSPGDREGGAGRGAGGEGLPAQSAYLAFTSGSTGTPKGIVGSHGPLSHFLDWHAATFGLGEDDRFSLLSGLAHDPLLRDVLAPLWAGGTLCIPDRGDLETPGRLAEWFARERVTVAHLTPAMAQLLAAGPGRALPALRFAFFGGDVLTAADVARMRRLAPRASLVNFYGATETPQAMGWRAVEGIPAVSVPVGRGIDGVQLLVLNRAGSLAGIGEVGEVVIRTPYLAQGYLDDPAATAERFAADPFAGPDGGRAYRTGDLGRYLPDGDVSFAGRADAQVKIRGFRVETGEVESALAHHPAVREAAVVARGEGANRFLAAFVVPARGETPEPRELRAFLATVLPEYMVPAAFVPLDSLPLTPNRKVDRRALARLPVEPVRSAEGEALPRTPAEEVLAGIWAEVLRRERVGIHDNFFELGGHSLLAAQVASRVREALGVELPLRALFEAPTVAGLAERIEASWHEAQAGLPAPPPLRPVESVENDGVAPLSFAQERLWFLDRLEPGTALYDMPAAVRLTGRLDRAALSAALSEIVRRHSSLRTTFATLTGRPVQVIDVPSPEGLPLPWIDLSALPEAVREPEARRRIAEEASRPFDLEQGPLVRARLLRLAPEEHAVVWNTHHIVSDGWSVGVVFVRELAALYTAFAQGRPSPLPELPLQYADYAVWQREWLQGPVLAAMLDWWRSRLAGAATALDLPADRPRAPVLGTRGGRSLWQLPSAVTAPLRALARSAGATPFMALAAGLTALLHRMSGQDDVLIGTPVANRSRVEVEALIGFFVNTLVLRGDLSGAPGFRTLLSRSRDTALGAYAHQELPFEKLVEELQPQRDLSRSPLFQVMLVLQNQPGGGLALPGLTLEPIGMGAGHARFELTLNLTEGPDWIGGGIGGWIDYATDLFDPPTIARLGEHLSVLLAAAVAEPERPVGELPLLTEVEKRQILEEWSGGRELAAGRCVGDLFAAQAARTPEAPALVSSGEIVPYAALEAWSNRLAWRLRALGVGPEVRVGVALERSPEVIAAFLGVLKAGGAYVPLDPSYPAERLAFMLADSNPRVLLTGEGALPPELTEGREAMIVRPPEDFEDPGPPRALPGSGPDSPVYVIYTSGSTGTPKGVVVRDGGLANFSLAMIDALGLGPGERFLQFASLSFDASAVQIFPTLLSGAALALHPDPTRLSVAELLELCELLEVTVLDLPAALWRQWVHEMAERVERGGQVPPGLHTFLTGGESLSRATLSVWASLLDRPARFFSSYGPTEATVTATLLGLSGGEVEGFLAAGAGAGSAIGRPLPGVRVALFDARLQPVPAGVPGELAIGGAGLARGYLDRPDLTADRFIPDPLAEEPGARLYRTGDLARWRNDGSLEFLGRADDQVKIRGFRIELGEVEAVLARHPAVRAAVATAWEAEIDPERPGLTDRRLAGYVVLAQPVTALELRGWMREHLPEPMVPSAIVVLDAFPTTPGGKIDRRALPRPEAGHLLGEGEAQAAAPRNPVEETLATVWARLLGVETLGIHDSFFDRGGHSLLATQVVSRVRDVFGVEMPLRDLFEAPTVAGFALRLETALRERAAASAPPLLPVSRDRELPLSFSQERLWFIDQLQPGNIAYVMTSAVRMAGTLDPAALAGALTAVVVRHEALRTSFPVEGGRPRQAIAPPAPLCLPFVDLAGLPEPEREPEMRRLIQDESRRPFDLARGPLIRAGLVRLEAAEHRLLLTLHHIVSDGWSMGILVRELAGVYRALAEGGALPELPALPVQYADFAAWQRSWLAGEALEAELAYWHRQLGGAPATLELPFDRPRPAAETFRGARRKVRVPRPLTAALVGLGHAEEATPFMVLLAAFQTLLFRLTGQQDLTVGSPVAGRTRAELEPLIGFFVNTLVLRGDLSGAPTFRELLARTRRTALEAYAHQEVPFEKLVEELAPQRNLATTPLFQVMLGLQNAPAAAVKMGDDLLVRPVESYNGSARFDLTLLLAQAPPAVTEIGLGGTLEYKVDLFDGVTIERWLGHWGTLLSGIAEDPDRRLADLPLLAPAEQHQVTVEWNDTGEGTPEENATLHGLFLKQAAARPEALAVMAPDQDLTYAELARQSEALAAVLIRQGLRPGGRVGVLLERSADAVASLLAVLQAGGAYVPLDPAYPAERLAFQMADAGAALLLTRAELLEGLELPEGVELVLVSPRALPWAKEARAFGPTAPLKTPSAFSGAFSGPTGRDSLAQGNALGGEGGFSEAFSPLPAGARAGDGRGAGGEGLAYIIYTSGSTGRPKGVMIEHRQAVNTLLDVNRRFGVREDDRVFAVSSLAFDLSVWDVFGTLAAGGTVVLPAPAPQPDPSAWSERMAQCGVTIWNSAPPLLEMLVESQAPLPSTLRLALLSGDWIPVPLPDRVRRQVPAARVVSLGGATEGSIWSILYPIGTVEPSWRSIPYGRPMAGQRFHIVDAAGRPAPAGVVGELCIGGAGVAMGYLGRPELTAERFVPDLFAAEPGRRLYRTGDLGRFGPDGVIEFLGRRDQQVKVRGYRVELGEIEAALARHPAVREAVVLALGEPRGDRRLAAFVVLRPEALPESVEPETLRAFVARSLPEPMVPALLEVLESLPLTPNGKVDRRALAERPLTGLVQQRAAAYVAPRDAVEERLAGVWRDLLGVEKVGVHDSFFALGGHSLLATRLVAAVREAFGVEVPLRTLFERPALEDLALVIAEARVERADAGDVERLLAELEEISDEEAGRLLEAESSSGGDDS